MMSSGSHFWVKAAFATLLTVSATPASAAFKFMPAKPAETRYAGAGVLQAPESAPLSPLSLTAPSSAAASARSGFVEGFARDVPLTVALRQILPRGVMFTVADDVDIATSVSWEGGRPWQEVLEDMLDNVSMRAIYSQNTVVIERALMAGSAIGTNAPVSLVPPVAAAPMIIDTPLAAPEALPELAVAMPQQAMQQNSFPVIEGGYNAPIAQQDYVVQGEVTSLDYQAPMPVTDEMPTANMLVGGTPVEAEILAVPSHNDSAATFGAVNEPLAEIVVPTLQPLDVQPVAETFAPSFEGAAAGQQAGLGDEQWNARSGQTMREVLEDWTDRAHVELNWLSEYDYPIQASLNYQGTFEHAVRTLLSGFKTASPQPIGRLHNNVELGQMALIIQTRGNLYED